MRPKGGRKKTAVDELLFFYVSELIFSDEW